MTVLVGDCRETLKTLDAGSVQCCVTSPPYWGLRDYGVEKQIGLEKTPDEYVAELVAVFREVRRVLKEDGTLWLNLGDSYAMTTKGSSGKGAKQISNGGTLLADRRWSIPRGSGLKPKDLVGIPWMVAFALRGDGWYLRSDIVWAKPNPMPESVADRPTKAHEYVFLLSKSERYFYDAAAVAETARNTGRSTQERTRNVGGRVDGFTGTPPWDGSSETRNRRTVWTVASEPCAEAHFAVMPSALVVPCILAGSRIGDTVLDPFGGSGTTARVATELWRKSILCELNPEYAKIIGARTAQAGLLGNR